MIRIVSQLFTTATAFFFADSFLYSQTNVNDNDVLLAMANYYRNNFESIKNMTCKYSVTWGFAKTLDEAVVGKISNPRIASVLLFKNGDTMKYIITEDAVTKGILDKPTVPKADSMIPGVKSGPLLPFVSSEELNNRKMGLIFSSRNKQVNIYDTSEIKKNQLKPDYILNPIFVDLEYDFATLSRMAIDQEISSNIIKPFKDQIASLSFRSAKDPTLTFEIDLSQGSIPIKIERKYESSKSFAVSQVTRIRELPNKRWFPERTVTFLKQTPDQTPCLTKIYEVQELIVDIPPAPEDMMITIPAGTNVCQFSNSLKYFKAKQQERIGPDDLVRIKQLTEEVPKIPQVDTVIVQPASRLWPWYLLGTAIILILSGFIWRRVNVSRNTS